MDDAGAAARATRIRTPDQRVRVFISSTLGELAPERQAARASVEQLRLTPIMFELGARPHPPRALYRSYLAQSDVFVGIYWQRYGWVAPDMEISGLEDELLLSEGMPRLVYVKRPAPDIEPRLQEVLRRLEGDGGPSYKPFGDAAELGALLLDDLSLLLAERFQPAPERPANALPPSNLPAATSSFVGRDAELERLGRLLGDPAVRLTTLAGAGGTGKTRLAVEAARSVVEHFADGVLFVDLASERQPDEVFAAVARTLALPSPPAGGSPLERLVQALAPRQVLLVLDNLEQATAAGPGLVELLERCPRVQALVTSREALRVSAEHVFPVPALSLPGPGTAAPTLEDVLRSEAGRLFVERAAAVGSGFVPTAEDAVDIAAICERLDGLPLAIELAAACVRLFSVRELREALDVRFDLLTRGGHDRPDRQRTLRDAMEWSDGLLSDDERIVFELASVFDGARLVDVVATLGEVPDVRAIDLVEVLGALVDKSLVQVTQGTDRRPRFSMLHTIREFAAEHLAASPARRDSTRHAHALHYSALACELQATLSRTDRVTVLARLGEELGNLRAAWAHWLAQRDISRLDDLLVPLWGYYEARGDYRTAMVLGEELLGALGALPESRQRRHDELVLRANLARTQLAVRGFSTDAERSIVEALELLESSDEVGQRFPALRSLTSLYLWRSDFGRGAATARELVEIAEQEQDPVLQLEAQLMSCISTSWPQDLQAAIDAADRAAAHFAATTSGFVEFRVGANPGVVAHAIGGLLRWAAGYPDAAVAGAARALELAAELDHPYSRAFALHHASLLDLWRGDAAGVEARAAASQALAEAHGYAVWDALARVLAGAARTTRGEATAGLAELEEGFARYEELTTPPIFWPALLAIRAAAHGAAGHADHALTLVEEARVSLDGDHPHAAEVALVHGDLLLLGPRPDRAGAQACFERAATRSAQRGARMIELQALTRLLPVVDGASADDVARRLRSVYEMFTEGHTTPPLLAAAEALDRT